MVGAIPGDAVMHARPIGRGYVHLETTAHHPWGVQVSQQLRGHEFHHSSLDGLDPGVAFAYRVTRGHGVDGLNDGVVLHNLLASYAHLRTAAGGHWAPHFIDFVRRERDAHHVATLRAEELSACST
jgi:cobyrinic acid a,c-diamide synthase